MVSNGKYSSHFLLTTVILITVILEILQEGNELMVIYPVNMVMTNVLQNAIDQLASREQTNCILL